jgi:hypothetical protein
LHDEVEVEMKGIEKFERENNERRAADARKHQEEVESMKAHITNLEDQILDIKRQAKKEKPPPIM